MIFNENKDEFDQDNHHSKNLIGTNWKLISKDVLSPFGFKNVSVLRHHYYETGGRNTNDTKAQRKGTIKEISSVSSGLLKFILMGLSNHKRKEINYTAYKRKLLIKASILGQNFLKKRQKRKQSLTIRIDFLVSPFFNLFESSLNKLSCTS